MGSNLLAHVTQALRRRRSRRRDVDQVAIIGRPKWEVDALNALTGEERAIVSPDCGDHAGCRGCARPARRDNYVSWIAGIRR